MEPFVIIADNACDVDEPLRQKLNIEVLPGHGVLPDGREPDLMPAFDFMDQETFYAEIRKKPDGFKTSPPNTQQLVNIFTRYASQGIGMLVINLSGAISGVYSFACSARKMVLEQYPDARICCVDSLRYGPGITLLIMLAAQMRDKGVSLEETAEFIEQHKNRIHQAGWLDDLSFVAKKGRISNAQAFFGTLAGIKPIGETDYNGLVTVLAKVKGTKAAYGALIGYMENTILDAEQQDIIVAHTNRRAQAEEYKRLIEEKFHPRSVSVRDVYPATAINVGPGLMAAFYTGKPISRDLSEEKKIINRYLGLESNV